MINESNSKDKPFKKDQHYRVTKEWYRNGTTFELGQEIVYLNLIYNRYDDVNIFCFKDVKHGYELRWPCSAYELDSWKDYFEPIENPNQ